MHPTMKAALLFMIVSSVAAFAPSSNSSPAVVRSISFTSDMSKVGLLSNSNNNNRLKGFDLGATDKENEIDPNCEEEDETKKGFAAIKSAGKAGAISLFLWEAAFWILAVPVCAVGYKQTTGHFPDFTDKSDLSVLGAEVFAFANAARFALPLRIGLAIGTIPFVQENIVDRFFPEPDPECEIPE